MKLARILTLCLAGMAFGAMAQTHLDGQEYYKADQIENAKDLLKRSMSNQQTDKAVSDYYLGLIAVDENKPQEAVNYFNQGIQQNPEYAYNYVGLGMVKLLQGNAKGAEEDFKTAEKHAKKDASLSVAIARAYYNADPALYEKQINKAMEKARKHDIENADIYLFEGDQLKSKKDIGGAAAKYEMAKNYDKNATAAYVKYGNLFTQVNPQFAIKMLKELLQVNPQSALGQRELANAYYNNKDFVNAAAQYANYVQNPSHFKSDEARYAFLLFYGGDYKKGYDYSTGLLASDPSNFTAQRYQFMNAAQIPEMKNEVLAMAEKLYASHKQNPTANKFAPIDYTLIADEFARDKRPAEAETVLKEAIKEMPENASFYKQLALVYVDENRLSDAANTYENYLKNTDAGYNDFIQQAIFSYYAGVENGANTEMANKYYDMAKSYADKAREILPDNYRPLKIYGDIAKQTANKADVEKAAAPFYLDAVKLLEASADPSKYKSDAKEMYNYLGNYYLDLKDVPTAKTYFEKYLQLDPDNAEYRKFVNSLK